MRTTPLSPCPPGKYRTICADPPWPIKWSVPKERVNGGSRWGDEAKRRPLRKQTLGYETMSVDEISALDVASVSEPNAHLYLWTFDRFLIDGTTARVAEAWGFTPLRLLIWKKPGFGLGHFPRPQHEAVLLARRGTLPYSGPKNIGSVQEWPHVYERRHGTIVRKHSGKPGAFFSLIEQVSPGPYLELFAREQRLGWDTWGNEALNHVDLAGASA